MVWQRLEEQFERYVLRRAAQLTTVSDPLAERLRSLHDKPVAVVPNGFDTEDFADACLTPPCEKKNVFTIVYTGKIYPRRQDPALLFQAVHQLSREGFIAPGEVEIHFIGRDLNGVAPLARQCGIETFVFVHPPVPYRESLRQQCRATVLLLLEWTDTSVRGYYSTKVFEYLGAGRPILAVGPRGGVIESLLGECSAGVLVNNSEEMVNVLRNWIDTFRHTGGLPAHANREAIKRYTREAQAGMLADILTKVTKESAR
jgi:glycosyltransferase involved in cell wall biosynthesis